MAKPRHPTFKEALALMRSRNAMDAEGGFLEVQRMAREHVAELMAAFAVEPQDGVRCWLLELIGEARAPEAFALLCEQSASADESLRSWAVRGLQMLGTPDARAFLYARGLPRA
ncbi:HEAT repeat domain-containing protein [Terricaulis sp.]|uniref:HEAT repeat domain-containing protein n=1 Tax=Terricaulis sp. TaxID=2768686 RepID=UPI003784AFA7